MQKFSLKLSTVSPYVSPTCCLPHHTFTAVPFFFFLVKTLKYSESFELQRSFFKIIVFQRKRRGKKSPSPRMMQVFHSPAAASSSPAHIVPPH